MRIVRENMAHIDGKNSSSGSNVSPNLVGLCEILHKLRGWQRMERGGGSWVENHQFHFLDFSFLDNRFWKWKARLNAPLKMTESHALLKKFAKVIALLFILKFVFKFEKIRTLSTLGKNFEFFFVSGLRWTHS